MNQSLINKYTGEVLQIVSGGADSRFEVHENFMWVTGPDEVEKGCDSVEYQPTIWEVDRLRENQNLFLHMIFVEELSFLIMKSN